MGRHIYADQVGISTNDPWVHKFWLAVQPTDVSDYLEAREVTSLKARLDVSQRESITAKMNELKDEFERTYGMSYDDYMESDERNEIADNRKTRAKQLLASRINLGEHLLQTIENMEGYGLDEQELEIDF